MNVHPHLERLRLLYPVRWRIAAGLLCMLLTVAAQLGFPQAIAYFIDHVAELTARGVTPAMVAAMFVFSVLYALDTLHLPLGILGRIGWPIVRPAMREGVRRSLEAFGRLVEQGVLPVARP